MTHHCHANGCSAEAHPEMPFCRRHAGMLPDPHKKRLWAERPVGQCGVCDPVLDAGDWPMLFNLGIAMLMLAEFGGNQVEGQCECGAPVSYRDDGGFCWICGVDEAEKAFAISRKAMEKYGIEVRS